MVVPLLSSQQQCRRGFFFFFTPTQTFLICRCFNHGNFECYYDASIWFDLHFVKNYQCWASFCYASWPSEDLFWRDVCVGLQSGFLYSCQCFDIEVSELFVYFETVVLWIILFATIFSYSLLFFYCSKAINLTKSHFLFLYYLRN